MPSRRGMARRFREWLGRRHPNVIPRLPHYPTDEEVIRAILTLPTHYSGITRVQHTSSHSGNSSSQRSLAYGSNVAAGSMLAAVVSTFNSGVTLTTTDTLNNASWTQAGSYALDGGTNVNRCSIWFYPNTLGGACTFKVTPSASAYLSMVLVEYSGVATVTPLDMTATNGDNASATTSVFTGTCTVSGSGELVLAGYGQGTSNGGASPPVSGTFSLIETTNSGSTDVECGAADDTNASANEGCTFTMAGVVHYAAIAASFTAGSVGPTIVDEDEGIMYQFADSW